MPKSVTDAVWDDPTAFAKFCLPYGLYKRRAAAVFSGIHDASAFCEALEALNTSLDKLLTKRFVDLIEAQTLLHHTSGQFGESAAIKKVSKAALRKMASQLEERAFRLSTDLAEFLVMANPAVEFLRGIDNRQRRQAKSLASLARTAVEPIERLECPSSDDLRRLGA